MSCEIDEPKRGAHAMRTAESGETFLSRKGLLCVWHLNQPEAPQKYHTNFVVIVVVEFSTANVTLIASARVVVFFFLSLDCFHFFWCSGFCVAMANQQVVVLLRIVAIWCLRGCARDLWLCGIYAKRPHYIKRTVWVRPTLSVCRIL